MTKNKPKPSIGAFSEIYGRTMKNRILEYFLENQDLDNAIGDTARELKIIRPKVYEVMKIFEKKGYVKKSRIVGKTQLYLLNKDNRRVKLFLKNFMDCLKIVAEEHGENRQFINTGRSVGMASARNF